MVFISSISFAQSEESIKEEYYNYFQVTEKPEFKTGTFSDYIAMNIIYPPQAVINKITGIVYVKFVIDKKGKVVDVEVARSVDPLLDKEAI
jgi:protein TonB